MNSRGRAKLLGSSWDCECGERHEVPTRIALIGTGVISQAPKVIGDLGLSGQVFLLADALTFDAAGARLEFALGGGGVRVRPYIMRGKPRADDITADRIATAVNDDDAIILSCGSGTITDLGKWAAFKRDLPHIAVATAPSMNGYASGIVALTRGGLKTTDPVKPPLAVIADIDILSRAPIEMIRAGLGDVSSKPVCNADWKLASIVRGEHFCRKPFDMIRDLEDVYLKDSALIGKRDPSAITTLAEALIYSGVSMVIAGSSSPASGAEHLISHFLDMRADRGGVEHDFHGAQVGVATVATAALYERIMSLDSKKIDARAMATAWERSEHALKHCRGLFGESGDAIAAEYTKKRGSRERFEAEVIKIKHEWDIIRDHVRPFLKTSAEMRSVLEAAGAKSKYSDLGISAKDFKEALVNAMCIRSRFTVLDLAFAVGQLEPWAEEMIDGPL